MQRLRKPTVVPAKFSNFPPFLPPSPLPTQPTTLTTLTNTISTNPSPPPQTPQNPFSKSHKNPIFTDREADSLHSQAIKTGSVQETSIYNHLLSLYAKESNLGDARKLFDEIPVRDVRSWTVLITGFTRMGLPEMGLGLFVDMQREGVSGNRFTLSCVFKCCGSAGEREFGKRVHGWMVRNGVGLDVALENSVVDFYVKCGRFDYAGRVFELMGEKNTVSWNIMIGACLQSGEIDKAVELFRRLPSKDVASWNTIVVGLTRNGREQKALEVLREMCRVGAVFDDNTGSIALLLAASLSEIEIGRQVHGNVLRMGYDRNEFITNSLIDMYCKCGDMERASKIFNRTSRSSERTRTSTPAVTNVSWSSMISGFVQNGRTEEAFELFHRMVCEAGEMDPFTLTSVIAACADVGVPEWGRQIHVLIEKQGYRLDEFLVSAIIDMYAKCGSLDEALSLFHQSNSKNIVLWTSMISGCALHGQGREATRLFRLMLEKGIKPNEISFVGVLSGCSHAGLVEEGELFFHSMREDYGIVPKVEHFTCMVDLLARAGRLNEAKEFIYINNISHLGSVWKALLSACQIHKNIDLGKQVTEQLREIEPFDGESYVLLSNIYTTSRRWKEAAETRSLMQKRGLKKQPGKSWIRLKNQVHTFAVGDTSHPEAADIYSYLERLIGKLREVGYSTDTHLITHDVEEEQREILLGFHSEKLAIAYGIMSTPSGSPITVMKNLRVCVDCHTAIKYISRVTSREITVRDARRFHHFKGGYCSCGDYW